MNGYLLKVADDPAFVAKARGRGERLAAATAGKARGRGEVPVLAPAPRACARQAGRSIYCWWALRASHAAGSRQRL